jgi:hypothetical protein
MLCYINNINNINIFTSPPKLAFGLSNARRDNDPLKCPRMPFLMQGGIRNRVFSKNAIVGDFRASFLP